MLGLGNSLIRNTGGINLYKLIHNNYSVANWDINMSTIRVRRSSDNAEQDFAPVNGSAVDTASILSFVGAGSGYVSIIYDSTGNGNHAQQSTASNQPRIVDAGVFEVDEDGRYSLYYDGTDFFDVVDSFGIDFTTGQSFSIMANFDRDSSNGYLITRNTNGTTDRQYAIYDTGGETRFYIENDFRVNDNTVDVTPKKSISTYNGSTVKIYLDSVLKDTQTYAGTVTSRSNVKIGCRADSVLGETSFLTGHISKITIFNTELTQAQVNVLTSKS